MRIKQVREWITKSVLGERRRCADLAMEHDCPALAAEILSAAPPYIRVVTHATVEKQPEVAKNPNVMVSGHVTLAMMEEKIRKEKALAEFRKSLYPLGPPKEGTHGIAS